jgi:RNA recognition motif-containing protein
MGKKLRVVNLSSSVTNEDLFRKFGQFGTVESAEVMRDQHTGRSKGFGFVEMATDAQALAAIRRLNFSQYGGLTMGVSAIRSKRTSNP